jgi:FkbM family methyltransferase
MQGIFYNKFDGSYIPHILKELYIEKVYAPYLEGKKDLVVVDAGSNVGLFTQYVAPYAKKIYAIEPAREHLGVLSHMVIYNKLTNVEIIPKALSHMNKEMMFFHSKNRTMHSLNKRVDDTGESEVVQTTTMDKLFKDYDIKHVDFMKLDVEGVEVDLVGSEGFEKVADKIDCMVVEWHQWSGRNPSQLVTTLRDYGFTVSPIQADASLFVAKR